MNRTITLKATFNGDCAYFYFAEIQPGQACFQKRISLDDVQKGWPEKIVLDFDQTGTLLGFECIGVGNVLHQSFLQRFTD